MSTGRGGRVRDCGLWSFGGLVFGAPCLRGEQCCFRMPCRLGLSVVMVLALVGFVWGDNARVASAAVCGNEAIRDTQDATFLPDCRAYEFVSPGSIPLVGVAGEVVGARAAVNGQDIAYLSRYPAEGVSRSGFFYLASRGPDGWSVEEVAPQDSPTATEALVCEQDVYFSSDLSRSVLSDGWDSEEETPGEAYCQSSEETLAVGAPVGYGNLFYREGTGSYELVNVTPGSVAPANARLQDATSDLDHVLFSEKTQLTPEALSGYDLYEWEGGLVRLVTFLPGGEPVIGRLADGASNSEAESVFEGHRKALAPVTHAVSADGETVFFYAEHEGGVNLYVREHAMREPSPTSGTKINGEQCLEPGKACTVEVDRVQGGSGVSGGGVFWYASVDGSRVFFTDESKLTTGAGATAGKPDLYEYNLETGSLIDVTPEALAKASANARGYSGASEDGSYLYFVARAALTGSQENGEGMVAQVDEPNLYLYHEGVLTFIATLRGGGNGFNSEGDFEDWQEEAHRGLPDWGDLSARVSPNGQYFGFTSLNELVPAIDDENARGERVKEIFLYSVKENSLICVSCGNEPSLGPSELQGPTAEGKPFGQPVYLSRNVLNDGRVFFTTPNKLVEQDTNGAPDAYEYENGEQHLISSGTASGGSVLYDVSESGDDVFFATGQSLLGADKDNDDSIYDARVEGGFPLGPGEEAEPPPCKPEACRKPVSGPPVTQSAASSTLQAPGNLLAPSPHEAKTRPHKLTRSQQLTNALNQCRKDRFKTKRKTCEARARKRYNANTKSKHHKNGKGTKR